MKKTLLFTIIFLLFSFPIFAADLEVSCTGTGSCNKSNSNPLFSSTEVWYPSMSLTKTVKITNTSASNQNIGIRADNFSNLGNLDNVMNLSIIQKSNNNLLWTGTLNIFFNTSEIILANINPGSFDDFLLKITMNNDAGNYYQNKNIKFDLLMGFIGTSTTETKKIIETGEIKGKSTKIICNNCIWWQILLCEIIALIILKKRFKLALLIPFLTYLIFLILNKNCITNFIVVINNSVFCQYFWLIDAITYFTLTLFWKKRIKTITSSK